MPGGQVEFRRFRTWEDTAHPPPQRAWLIILRYGLLRVVRTWYLSLLLVLAVLYLVIFLGANAYELPRANAVTHGEWLGAMLFTLMPTMVFVFFLGAPLFAEDLRFNAPLFYLSKPLRVGDYVVGRAGILAAAAVALTLVPALLASLMVLGLGVAGTGPMDAAEYEASWRSRYSSQDHGDYVETWRIEHIDTFGDWLYAFVFSLLGLVSTLAFIVGATLACSAYTRRSWHAAMALVAVVGGWSMLGTVASELADSALGNLFGPAGWYVLVLDMPLRLRFDPAARGAAGMAVPESLDFAIPAVFLAHVLLLGMGALGGWLAWRRLHQQEAVL